MSIFISYFLLIQKILFLFSFHCCFIKYNLFFLKQVWLLLLFFWTPFALNILSHPFTFSLCISLKWVSCKHGIVGSCFLSSFAVCLLIGDYSPLTFKLIIDRKDLTTAVLRLFQVFILVPSFSLSHNIHLWLCKILYWPYLR